MDFKALPTSELKRRLKFHENDRGTMTMAQKCARMYFIQEYTAELQRRGEDHES